MAFCRSPEYWLVPVKLVLPLELELEELELLFAVRPFDEVAVEVREPMEVLINDSRAGQEEMSYPAREGSSRAEGRPTPWRVRVSPAGA
jgi:hypothetical protein